MDPWIIAPNERVRHEEQFRTLNPAPNGMVTGAQARNFFLQSGLPPTVLAQIWGLADVNGDGQMDINEFSLACKMITMKLKGFEVPKSLPPPLSMAMASVPPHQSSMNMMAMQPMQQQTMAPMGGMMMSTQQPMMPAQPQMMAGQMPGMQMPMGMPVTSMPMGMSTAPGMGMPMASMGMPATSMGMPVNSMGMPATSMGMPVNSLGMSAAAPMALPPATMNMGMNMPAMGSVPGAMMTQPTGMMQPATASAPMSVASSSAPHSGASTPGVSVDWAIPQPTRSRYGQQFQATDRSRTGFIAGVQARNLLLQSGLPQNILAQIWALSDVDGDGRLSAEEFILSGYLCEIAQKGEPLPATLPQNLVPPSMRKGGGKGPSTPVKGPGTPDDAKSFEDKRRENFNKGQAELERRRQSLLEQQKKEEEERKRKEKEEKEERERQKQEMERQKLAEWEKQRKAELTQHRQREEEKVFALKAKYEHINKDLETLRDKVKTLTDGIGETRSGVTDVKAFIDGMRTSRDSKMQEMTNLKNKLKDQNARLLTVTQEKAKLDAKVKLNQENLENGEPQEVTEYELKKQEKEKQVLILKERLQKLRDKEEETKTDLENEKLMLKEHREKLKQMITSCKALYEEFDPKRREIKAEKAKRIRELTDPSFAWETEKPSSPEVSTHEPMAPAVDGADTSGYIAYRAIYDFDSRNPDELPFKTGDIIMVHPGQPHEPGWLGGELNGKVGWFPETYVEPVSEPQAPLQTIAEEHSDVIKARALFDWTAVQSDNEISFLKGDSIIVLSQADPAWWLGRKDGESREGYFPSNHVTLENLEPRGSTPVQPPDVTSASPQKPGAEQEVIKCVALYPFSSEEPGDLNFEAGETIDVLKKDGDWWTGQVDGRIGVFPFNYVQPIEKEVNDETAGVEHIEVALPTQEPPTTIDSSSESEGEGKSSKKPELATVIAPYSATGKEQLSLQKGQMILIRKRTDTGWWQGEIQATKGKKRQVGWFPASYVKLMEGGGDKAQPASAADAQADHVVKPVAVNFRALFPYVGQHEDELSFQAGDIIALISKDEEAWWKGSLNGNVGVFPSNYVEVVEDN